MRKIFILISVLFLITSCKNSPEDRAKKLITADLQNSLHDFKSYEPVSYSPLTDAYSDLEHNTEIPELMEAEKELAKEYRKAVAYEDEMTALDAKRSWILEARARTDSIMKLRKLKVEKAKEIETSFKPEKIGLQLTHKYRAKTLGGNMKLSDRIYVFDSSVTKIIEAYEAD